MSAAVRGDREAGDRACAAPVIATAASARYFPALVNLVGSIHHWAPGTAVAVFDLGLDAAERARIERWRDVRLHWAGRGAPAGVRLRGRWRRRPHLSVPRYYAWKPIAIAEAVDTYGSALWLDAGSDLRGPLAPIVQALDRDGCFLVRGQDLDMSRHLHADCARRLGHDKAEFAGLPSYAGNTQGYVRGSNAAAAILAPLVAAACDKRCISPRGAHLFNHRYDQSVLSVIAYTCGLAIDDHTALIAAHRHEVRADPATASDKRVYTARGTSADYAACVARR